MIKVLILSPSGMLEFQADEVFLPGSFAPFEVLPGHAPIISTLEAGRIRWRAGGEEDHIDIRSGTVRLYADTMTICAESEDI